jgi:magnesium-transporting ATPase (P-type)
MLTLLIQKLMYSVSQKYPRLVVIEMFNAMNALSSSESLLTLPLWKNMALVYAIMLSMTLHFALLYIPFLQGLFSVIPLNWNEWKAVVLISLPVMYVSITFADSLRSQMLTISVDSSMRFSSSSSDECIWRDQWKRLRLTGA